VTPEELQELPLARRVAWAVGQSKMGQDAYAAHLGVARETLSAWVNGDTGMPVEVFVAERPEEDALALRRQLAYLDGRVTAHEHVLKSLIWLIARLAPMALDPQGGDAAALNAQADELLRELRAGLEEFGPSQALSPASPTAPESQESVDAQ
jgi:hypothetical protein